MSTSVNKNVSAVAEDARGLKLAHFKLQTRSEFQVGRAIWFQFHYDNLTGAPVPYGSMGMAIHKWDGSAWRLHAYKHSFGGSGTGESLPAAGGPGGGAFHDDHWKADEPGEFALTPYISFDPAAALKIETHKDHAAVDDVFHMAMPLYAAIKRDKAGSVHDNPPAPLFADKSEDEESEEEVDLADDGGDDSGGADLGRPPVETVQPGQVKGREVTRQVIQWHEGSGVGAVRIEVSRRHGDQWLVHTVLSEALDADNRIEVVFLRGE